ncbi:thioredoxin family protein [Hymenobacter negativus]|uniref:Thioredoxin family protein n=1 Tax=Hymenobacter negativus TaxID=2795026 RepID=A0ABS3QII6_9BACT|nr:thioredoxin family protein [Hymenobacter negativus]MBO2011060.1 thioredoxin family protein [Hymenobacter negativus]
MNILRYAFFLLPLLGACSESATHNRKAVITEYKQAGSKEAFTQFLRTASPAGRVQVVYFYADWCGPCRRFREALPSEEVDNALQQTALIKVNVDSCQELAAYYEVNVVPTFVKVDAQGQPVAKITSAEWGEDVPNEIAPVMTKLVSSKAYALKK